MNKEGLFSLPVGKSESSLPPSLIPTTFIARSVRFPTCLALKIFLPKRTEFVALPLAIPFNSAGKGKLSSWERGSCGVDITLGVFPLVPSLCKVLGATFYEATVPSDSDKLEFPSQFFSPNQSKNDILPELP